MHLLSPDSLDTLIQHFGYVAIILVITLESAGLPLPGEATLITAALVAAETHVLSLPLVIGAAAFAAILGDNLGFWVGRRFGIALLLRYGGRIGLDQPRLKLGQYLFMRHGGAIVFFGRFVAVLRAFAAVLAGANRYSWSRFLAFNTAGGIVWATLYASAAYAFGRSIHRVEGLVGAAVLLVAAVGGWTAWRALRRHEAALQAEAERVIPGPLTAGSSNDLF